jgi:transcriptional regulator with AAA-type ATPase domain
MPSFLRRLINNVGHGGNAKASPGATAAKAFQRPHLQEENARRRVLSHPQKKRNVLFAFVDLKDPFAPSEIAGEEIPGPILSIMSAKDFGTLHIFDLPDTIGKGVATKDEVSRRYPDCTVVTHPIPVSDPRDYSSMMGYLSRHITKVMWGELGSPEILKNVRENYCREYNYVCVSSGTAEMRAAWFLLYALGIMPARLLQVGTPAHPLFGAANVRELRIADSNWRTIRDLVMPNAYFRPPARDYLIAGKGPGELRPQKSSLGGPVTWPSGSFGREDNPKQEPPMVPGLDDALQELGLYVGSPALRRPAEQAGIAATSDLPALLLGETGTGKERFAHLIHRLSTRFRNDIVTINCAAIPKDIAESYLFGHTKGAFTGASADKKGVFESADCSTLFLDEIAELTLEVQAKLLRVIEDGAVLPLGSTTPRKIDVRIVAATNRDLKQEVSAGRFREDLYFRLEVLQIILPALRDRRIEVPQLAVALLRQINQRRHKPCQLSKEALSRLERYNWPGNVRQLSNVLERSVLYARSEILAPEDLLIIDDLPGKDIFAALPEPFPGFSIEDYLSRARGQFFLRALAACKGNQAEAAKLLGVTRQAVSKFVAGNPWV